MDEACPPGTSFPGGMGVTWQCGYGGMEEASNQCKPTTGCTTIKEEDAGECRAICSEDKCNANTDCYQRNDLYPWGVNSYYDDGTASCVCHGGETCNDPQPILGCTTRDGGDDFGGSAQVCFAVNSEDQCDSFKSSQTKGAGCFGDAICTTAENKTACSNTGAGCAWKKCRGMADPRPEVYDAESTSGCVAYVAPCVWGNCALTQKYEDGACKDVRRRRLSTSPVPGECVRVSELGGCATGYDECIRSIWGEITLFDKQLLE